MIKKLSFLVIMFFVLAKTSFAGGFNLKSIGKVSTEGQELLHWWYSGLTPVMVGEATASSEVTVSIDGTESKVTADASGSWTYNPGALTSGDHKIILTNSGSTISFTLTLGAENVDYTAVGSGSAETLPTAGITFPTLILMGIGGVLLLTGKKLVQKN